MPSERSQTPKATDCMIPTLRRPGKGKTGETHHTGGCQGLGQSHQRGLQRSLRELLGVMEKFYILIVLIVNVDLKEI